VGWPDGKVFAFSIFDDTDWATVDGVRPVYDLLRDLGLRTTKSVWAASGDQVPRIGGSTCEDLEYRNWTLRLQADGFEIASHGATPVTSPREAVRASLDRFRTIYGHDPLTLANHADCRESIYWGEDRVDGCSRLAYNALTGFRRRGHFRGHREGDALFWGDLCRERVRYVRNFTFSGIDTLAACPVMPYHDPRRPYVNAWFASSEGADVATFNSCLSESNQELLETDGGACIMYTHFASGFVRNGKLDSRFVSLMERLAQRGGWYVPVATLLDWIAARRGVVQITSSQRAALERQWLRSKIRVGRS
jgi:hypothetical protein